MADERSRESMLGGMKRKAKEAQASVADRIADASESVQGKVLDATAGVNEILPVIRELGYTVEGINVAVGLIPDVTIDISGLAKTIEDGRYQEVLEEHKDSKLRVGVIKALQGMSLMHQKVQIGQMTQDTASITLGFPPKVTLKFKRTV